MGKELQYIKEQNLFWEYTEEIHQVFYSDWNKSQREKGDCYGTSLDCFYLGVIIGKRIERAKCKKINKRFNDKGLEREEELLAEIEKLKLENAKLKTSMLAIINEANKILVSRM